MRVSQTVFTGDELGIPPSQPADLVLVFAGPGRLDRDTARRLGASYPGAAIIGCSTAGEIAGTRVLDRAIVATAVKFDRTKVRSARAAISGVTSREAGRELAAALAGPDLTHVFVLSDGLTVNGSELVKGLTEGLPRGVSITGGLSGDGDRFQETSVLVGGVVSSGQVAAVGFYGSALKVGCGSLGGWDAFGPDRIVTRSEGNVLYELDGRSALQLYREYLGDHAAGLPATGLLFPLSLRTREGAEPVVRTILGVDEASQSLTFAGDVPTGSYARLMMANIDRLIEGAAGAARVVARPGDACPRPALAILVSCVGRRLVLGQRTEEEVEAVREVVGDEAVLTGFYSYGEISPFTPAARCELHNQTMTITTFTEC
ncbi:MAG: FIST signal transduction protein [Gemmatimonadales bacterium]